MRSCRSCRRAPCQDAPLLCRCRWLGPRLAAVEELHMKVDSLPWMPSLQLSLLRTAVKGVGMAAGGAGPLPLAKLSFDWDGGLDLECTVEQLDRLQSLRKVAIFGAHFDVVVRMPPFSTLPSLTDFSLIGGHLEDESVLDGPWLPPTLTALCLSEDRLERLPGVLRHLPALRSLVIDANHFDVEDKAVELEPQGLNALRFVTALEELNLSACLIADPLPQVSI